MIGPSPTQQPPAPPAPEQKRVISTPAYRRPGETPVALFVKRLLRPIFKVFYYVIKGIRTHKLFTLLAIILLVASISLTTFFTTGRFPLGIGSDPFNFHTSSGNLASDHVKNWLYALRDADATKMSLLQQELIMSQPPSVTDLISQYSQSQGHVSWKAINVIGTYNESDTSTDMFVEVDISSAGPGGNVTGIMIWHFVTLQSRMLTIELVSGAPRAPLQ